MSITTEDPLTAKINIIELGSFLNKMESHHSPFETHIKQLETQPIDTFLTFGKISPLSFTKLIQTLETHPTVSEKLPKITALHQGQVFTADAPLSPVKNKRIAVLFSGGPASGGHNVLVGIKAILGEENTLYGVRSGPKGLLNGDLFEITARHTEQILNSGGFDFLGSDRTKIKTKEQIELVRAVVKRFVLDGIIIIGGDDSNTNAAFLAENLIDLNCALIGVPKTIDGDLQVKNLLPISFGFDTATKIYSELVGNILQDTPSSRKYWHFVKLMGRSASHVALEVALQTKATYTLISEEIEEEKWTLNDITTHIGLTILKRAATGANYGVVIVPEGAIEFIPEFKTLIAELNTLLSLHQQELTILSNQEKLSFLNAKISQESRDLLTSLPEEIKTQLILDRDSHGNLQVSQIPTELLLIEMVKNKIKNLKSTPQQWGNWTEKELDRIAQFKFATNPHFFGYEGRCGAPTRFDAQYTFNLGLIAGSLALANQTGYMAAISQLENGWQALALPLSALMGVESREGQDALVIKKALVETHSPAFIYFSSRREKWAKEDAFCNPGPIQLWGPVSSTLPLTVALNNGFKTANYQVSKTL